VERIAAAEPESIHAYLESEKSRKCMLLLRRSK
jgi:hypothetical protein